MHLSKEHKRILDGKRGKILQDAMLTLISYGTVMGAEEFIPVSSVHTAFVFMKNVAMYFPPRRVLLTEKDVAEFIELISKTQVSVKTTTNVCGLDLEKWQQMGVEETTYNLLRQAINIATKCGIVATHSCTPHLLGNTPLLGEHCSWCETSAIIYCNSILGARTNRDSSEASLASAFLGITPNFGMHLDENRKGTDLIDVQCEINGISDWGALGFFTGERVGVGVPVFANLRRPTVEEAKQLGTSINIPGAVSLFHIPGATPEAPTIEAAFGENVPSETYIFDESAKNKVYNFLNHDATGKVDVVSLGCPHATLYEIKEICRLIEGKHVAKGTRLRVVTTYPNKMLAEKLGYAQILEASGGELFADGCLTSYYGRFRPEKPLGRVATDALKQAYGLRRLLASSVFFGSTERCIDIAIRGES